MTKKTEYTGLGSFSHGLAPVARNGKWGYINTSGEEVIECKFRQTGLDCFNEYGYVQVRAETGKYGVIDRSGNYVVKPEYEYIRLINNSPLVYAHRHLSLQKTSRPIAINPKKENQILGKFVSIGGGMIPYATNGYVPVKNDEGRWGLINEDGSLMLPFIYDTIDCYNYGRCENDVTGNYFVASSGGKITELYDDEVHYQGGKYGLITAAGEVILDFKYDELYYASDDCIIIGKGKRRETRKYGVITLGGKTVLPCKYSDIYVGDGTICFEDLDTGKCGWADIYGNILVQPKFYRASFLTGFSDGLMAVKQRYFKYRGKVGYVNKAGELVIPFTFAVNHNTPAWVGDFHDGLADYALSNYDRGWIDKKGEVVIPPIYFTGCIKFGKDGLIPVWLGDEGFYIDRTGTRCLPHVAATGGLKYIEALRKQDEEYEEKLFY